MQKRKKAKLESIKKLENIKARTGNRLKISKDALIYSFRYVYITVFFFLLSGIFAPILKGKNYELPFVGVIILFVGLMGAIFVYESTQQSKKIKYMVIGFILLGLSTTGIYMVVGF
jgi:hypothetical protein